MIVIVDFDGTLALGNKSHISTLNPNYKLIERLLDLKEKTNPTIKIVTARGSKNGLTTKQKEKRYLNLIKCWLKKYNVPFDCISFNKEYGNIYIDDMTIGQNSDFSSFTSPFTKNKIITTDETVIKNTSKALEEFDWYERAKHTLNTPAVHFVNDEVIITERIKGHRKPTPFELLDVLSILKNGEGVGHSFDTYINNISNIQFSSDKTLKIISSLPCHEPTFFHGDLSTSNVLVNDKTYLIDSNSKNIFGSYLTDAGKSFFSFIAYEKDYNSAKIISDKLGKEVLYFAVSEGLRVCKYDNRYISIVNNIADLI